MEKYFILEIVNYAGYHHLLIINADFKVQIFNYFDCAASHKESCQSRWVHSEYF